MQDIKLPERYRKRETYPMRNKDKFDFFRIGLVAGLITKEEIINWADRELLSTPMPDPEVIEVSLAGKLTCSQIVGLLNTFNSPPDHDLPVRMALAYAFLKVQNEIARTKETIQGIRLIRAETGIEAEILQGLTELDNRLEKQINGGLSLEELHADLLQFLNLFSEYRDDVNQVFNS